MLRRVYFKFREKEEQEEQQEKQIGDGSGGLVIAAKNEILAFQGQQLWRVAKREDLVKVLCMHENELYDAGAYPLVFETRTNKEVAETERRVFALCSFDGDLYYGNAKGEICIINKGKIAERGVAVRSLCAHKGKMYDGGGYKNIFETLPSKKIASRKHGVYSLCSHEGRLYDASSGRVSEALAFSETFIRLGVVLALCSHGSRLCDAGNYGSIFETKADRMIAKREGSIRTLCSHQGKVYDGGSYKGMGVIDLNNHKTDTAISEVEDISSIISVEGDILEKILQNTERVK